MNNFWFKKCEKGVTDVRKGKSKGKDFSWLRIGNVLHYLILLLSVSSTVKPANVVNYHITI